MDRPLFRRECPPMAVLTLLLSPAIQDGGVSSRCHDFGSKVVMRTAYGILTGNSAAFSALSCAGMTSITGSRIRRYMVTPKSQRHAEKRGASPALYYGRDGEGGQSN